MTSLLIRNAAVVTFEGVAPGQAVLIRDGKIAAVGADAEFAVALADEILDAGGAFLAPGFIDLHIHGLHRFLIDHGPEALAEIAKILPRYGVTGFLPTMCPLPKGRDAEFLKTLAQVSAKAGAAILGFHLEGPFLSMTGALPKDALGKADPERVKALMAAAHPFKTVFSISPEFEGIESLLPLMLSNAPTAFITHTRASAAQTLRAIDAGARHATHFYDVFPLPPESEPGVRPAGTVEAIYADPRASVDFILDGVHVDPIAVRAAWQAKGPDRVCLITDANVGAGLGPGRYRFTGDMEVEIARLGVPARLTAESHFPGALAGSGLTLDQAMRNAMDLAGFTLPQAVRMAGANPAKVLGLDGSKGRVAVGYDADLVLLDATLNVRRTWVGGRSVFRAS